MARNLCPRKAEPRKIGAPSWQPFATKLRKHSKRSQNEKSTSDPKCFLVFRGDFLEALGADSKSEKEIGAGERIRTVDLYLGKVSL